MFIPTGVHGTPIALKHPHRHDAWRRDGQGSGAAHKTPWRQSGDGRSQGWCRQRQRGLNRHEGRRDGVQWSCGSEWTWRREHAIARWWAMASAVAAVAMSHRHHGRVVIGADMFHRHVVTFFAGRMRRRHRHCCRRAHGAGHARHRRHGAGSEHRPRQQRHAEHDAETAGTGIEPTAHGWNIVHAARWYNSEGASSWTIHGVVCRASAYAQGTGDSRDTRHP